MSRDPDDVLDEGFLDEDDEDTLKDRYLTFCLADEDYGVEIRHVTEIVVMKRITEVPNMPSFVRGVINLRGNVIPVIDMRLRFRLPERAYDERTCILVVDIRETSVGLVVDTVQEVITIAEERVTPPPRVAAGTSARYILGIGRTDEDEVKILLDLDKLLFENELEDVAALTDDTSPEA